MCAGLTGWMPPPSDFVDQAITDYFNMLIRVKNCSVQVDFTL